MGFWSKIFGTGNVVEKGLEIADEAFYTNQEKAANFERLMKIYEPFKLIQRFMVLIFCVPFALLHTVIIVMAIFGGDVVGIAKMINDAFGYPVAACVSLFLTGGVIEGGVRAWNERQPRKE